MAERQIIAGSAGIETNVFLEDVYSPVMQYAVGLAESLVPKVCYLDTAQGDSYGGISRFYDASLDECVSPSHLSLFPRPNHEDPAGHLLNQDVIWVGGGSVANLLAVWRTHEIDKVMEEAWHKGIILGGVSAGSICWHEGGTTDSFGKDLRAVTNGLGFLPYGCGVHYDAEEQRRPLFQELVREGVFQEGYATDNGAAIHYVGTALHKVISGTVGRHAYHIEEEKGRFKKRAYHQNIYHEAIDVIGMDLVATANQDTPLAIAAVELPLLQDQQLSIHGLTQVRQQLLA